TISLGNWQTRRAEEKLELGRRLDEAAKGPVLSVPSVRLDASALERRRVSARGRFVARAALLLDNKVLHGAAGYHVLTPLKLEGGELHVLVNRGWIAAGERARLPAVPTPAWIGTAATRCSGIRLRRLPPSSMSLSASSEPVPGAAEDRRRGRRIAFVILALCAAPTVAAWLAYFVWQPQSRLNYGELIEA